jgi:hypothetical protein
MVDKVYNNIMNVILGTNDFFGVPFPLVLADRFFHIYYTDSGFKIDIFRWDEKSKKANYEVKGSEPLTENIDKNPTGIVTFSKLNTGTFLYKFRPKPGISQIFGRIPVENEYDVKINDHSIEVVRNGEKSNTYERNKVEGYIIGLYIHADGSEVLGSNRIPEGMNLRRS